MLNQAILLRRCREQCERVTHYSLKKLVEIDYGHSRLDMKVERGLSLEKLQDDGAPATAAGG